MASTDDSSAESRADKSKGVIHPVFSKAWEEGTLFRRPKEIVTSFWTDAYRYTALPHQTCIRLLNIKPGKSQDMIEVDLRTVDLTERPRYTALSYSWQRDRVPTPTAMQALGFAIGMGKAFTWDKFRVRMGWREDRRDEEVLQSTKPNEETRYILCNGKYLAIWPNLYQAMLRLRQSRPGDYWVDAVCINQDDQEEKGYQIQMMGHIYESAELVTVWLGTCPTIFDSGMRDLLAQKLQQTNEDHARMVFSAMWLLTRKWFCRLRVLQEACLAKEILFFGGEHEVDAQTLVTTIDWLTNLQTLGPFVFLSNILLPLWGTHIKYVPAILKSREDFHQGGKWPLVRWLEAIKGRKTSQIKDYVFAGLGLVQPETLTIDTTLQLKEDTPPPLPQRRGNPGPKLSAHIRPAGSSTKVKKLRPEIRADVEADPEDIFLHVAACLLSQPNGIDLLLSTGQRVAETGTDTAGCLVNVWKDFDPALAELPSWIFNPTARVSSMIEPLMNMGLGKPPFAACNQLPNNAKISADGTLLHLDIIVVDKIEKQWETPAMPEEVLEILSDLLAAYETIGEDTFTVVARTLIAGLWDDAYPPPAEALDAFRVWLCKGGWANFLNRKAKETDESLSPEQQRQALEEVEHEGKHQESQLSISQSEGKSEWDEPTQLGPAKKLGKAIEDKRDKEKHKEMYQAVVERFTCHQWPNFDDPVSEEDAQLAARYFKILLRMQTFRASFVTERGMLGQGPSWAQKGDAIMLVKGASLPHIFAHADKDLERKINTHKKDLEDPKKGGIKGTRMRLERQLKELEAKIGRRDAWRLVGEAYVDGVMMGEAAVPSEFQRIDVL